MRAHAERGDPQAMAWLAERAGDDDLDFPAQSILQAFHLLSRERTILVGMGAAVEGPIPWTAMDRMAERAGLDALETDLFVDLICLCDSIHMDRSAKRTRATQPRSDADGAGRSEDRPHRRRRQQGA